MNRSFDAYVARKLKTDLARFSPPEGGRVRLLRKAILLPLPSKALYETGPAIEPLGNHSLYRSIDWMRLFSNWTVVYSLETGLINARIVA